MLSLLRLSAPAHRVPVEARSTTAHSQVLANHLVVVAHHARLGVGVELRPHQLAHGASFLGPAADAHVIALGHIVGAVDHVLRDCHITIEPKRTHDGTSIHDMIHSCYDANVNRKNVNGSSHTIENATATSCNKEKHCEVVEAGVNQI